MNIQQSIPEVKARIANAVLLSKPDASLAAGTPLSDILLTRLPEIISEERQLVNITANIARVAPMFDSAGDLLPEYADYADYLNERFFLLSPDDTEVLDTVYLTFNKKGNISIIPGSVLYVSSVTIPVSPVQIYKNSALWIQTETGYMHPIQIPTTSLESSLFIPATDEWVTGDMEYRSEDPTMVITGALSRKNISTTAAAPVTLDNIRNSISNRSLSNRRAVKYNLQNRSVFSPDQLLKADVMHVSDPAFIERRQLVFSDSRYALSTIVSGNGKVLLDYGNALRVAPVTLEYISRTDPVYEDLNRITILDNPLNILRDIVLEGLTAANTDSGILYGTADLEYNAISEVRVLTVSWYKVSTLLEADKVCSGSYTMSAAVDNSTYSNMDIDITEENSSGITGRMSIVLTPDIDVYGLPQSFRISADTLALYKISTSGLGLLSPVSAGSSASMEELKTLLESADVTDILTPYTSAAALLPGTTVIIRSDDSSQIKSFAINGVPDGGFIPTDILTDKMYWRVLTVTSGSATAKYFMLSVEPTFSVTSKLISRTVIPETYTAEDVLILEPTAGAPFYASIQFAVDYASIVDDTESDNYLALSGNFKAVSNSDIIIGFNAAAGAANSLDGAKTYLLYYGTSYTPFLQSLEAFTSTSNAEAGQMLIPSPFRPVVFNCSYAAEYIQPFLADKDYSTDPNSSVLTSKLEDTLSKYTNLIAEIELYMNDYVDNVELLDMAEIAKDLQTKTGLLLRKLDFTVFTQRGTPIRGSVNIDSYGSSMLNWTDIVAEVSRRETESESMRYVAVPSVERDALTTVSSMYKPVFSRVRV